jgi:cyclic pyranopterin monophosphate synthase
MVGDPLSHFGAEGAARMVSIGEKAETRRTAVATGAVQMHPETLARIVAGDGHKGDVLAVARLAAIGAAKQTASLIPLCHPVRLTRVDVDWAIEPERNRVEIQVLVEAVDRTGPEMEAMVAASTGLLTIYDMCKAMDRGMVVSGVMLTSKSGGKSGGWTRGQAELVRAEERGQDASRERITQPQTERNDGANP